MNRQFRKSHIVFLLSAFFACMPIFSFAASVFYATPLIIDKKAYARDIIKEKIGLANGSERTVQLFAFVNNVDPTDGVKEFSPLMGEDLSDSLANWIEITRGAQTLSPAEKREIPLLIQVNLRAVPGMYHAFVSFAEGSTRDEAEKNIKNGVTIAVNLEVLDDSKEVLQLNNFISKDTFITSGRAQFAFNIQNIGNRALAPKGDVRIFNKKGEEVATIAVNQKGETIDPSATTQLASAWNAGNAFGRYKAMLNVQYGDKEPRGFLQDTVFFWLIPWKVLLSLFFSLMAVVMAFAIYGHNRYLSHRNQPLVRVVSQAFSPNVPVMQEDSLFTESKMRSITRTIPKKNSGTVFAETPAAHHQVLNPSSVPRPLRRDPPRAKPGEWTDAPSAIPVSEIQKKETSSAAVYVQSRPLSHSETKYIVNLKK